MLATVFLEKGHQPSVLTKYSLTASFCANVMLKEAFNTGACKCTCSLHTLRMCVVTEVCLLKICISMMKQEACKAIDFRPQCAAVAPENQSIEKIDRHFWRELGVYVLVIFILVLIPIIVFFVLLL